MPRRDGVKTRALTPTKRAADRAKWSHFVRTLRQMLGWSQGRLASELGLNGPAAVCRWEMDGPNGTIPCKPAQKMLVELAKREGLVDEEAEKSRKSGGNPPSVES